MRLENTILRHLLHDETYMRKVIPFLKLEYFQDSAEKILFTKIQEFVLKYNSSPSRETLHVEIENKTGLGEEDHKNSQALIDTLNEPEKTDPQWLLDETEKFCQDRALYNAVMNSISILDGRDKVQTKEALPEILKSALSVSFDTHIGHDFLEDYEERYDYYHRVEEKIPFDLDMMNKITRGGFSKKSLNIIMAGVGAGKTLTMCHMAAANLTLGRNVLYITMEMAEERIAERIDANLLGVMVDELANLPHDSYEKKVLRVREKVTGKLIIKEYPTASAHVGHFRHLLNELNLKRSFIPDIIYIDYLNICMSSRIKQGSNINSYTYVKSIAEELRGLAVEKNVPVVSATQTTRTGSVNSDPDMTDTSESFGLPATADLMIAIISTDELQALNQLMIKQLKNRYADPTIYKRFVVGVDRPRMKLYDVEQSAQKDIYDGPKHNSKKSEEGMKWGNTSKNDFSGLKVL